MGRQKKAVIPGEVVLEDGRIIEDQEILLREWCNTFKKLYQKCNFESSEFDKEWYENIKVFIDLPETWESPYSYRCDLLSDIINDGISKKEVEMVVKHAKKGKAVGIDKLPNEVFKNEHSLTLLHKLFLLCFESGLAPSAWGKAIINPILKGNNSDARDPRVYRGISLISCIGKLYSGLLNHRLTVFLEMFGVIVDEQNGFRQSRSCLEHLSSLTSILRNRQLKKLPTYCCFIDMAKAFDSVNRDYLFYKLQYCGVKGKLYAALKSLYLDQECAVKINDTLTDWFKNNIGVRQGDPLSPSLFSLFINDLALELNEMNLGVRFGEDVINILLYADDVVILAENETALQCMIDKCWEWCMQWQLKLNTDKTRVVHFGKKSSPRTRFEFKYYLDPLLVVEKYKYLGVILDENLNFKTTADTLADSSRRAFGFVVSKFRSLRGIDNQMFERMCSTCINPIMDYASGVWGFKKFDSISVVENKMLRYFLGVHRFVPNLALWGDMGWIPSEIRRKVNMVRLWCKLIRTNDDRLIKRVLLNDIDRCKTFKLKNWSWEVKQVFEETNQLDLFDSETKEFCLDHVIAKTETLLFDNYKNTWKLNILNYPKLRTYLTFKINYEKEGYVKSIFNRSERTFLAQFRMGILPLSIETGRFTSPITPLSNRICKYCDKNEIEDERHFLIYCPMYQTERLLFFEQCKNVICDFGNMDGTSKFKEILNCNELCNYLAKFIKTCYKKRY